MRVKFIEPNIQLEALEYYTVDYLSKSLGIPSHHFIKLVRAGELHGRKIGKAYVINAREFDEWVKTGTFEFSPRQRVKSKGLVQLVGESRVREQQRMNSTSG